MISWLGVALAGGVNVPISANLGTREASSLIRQAGARYVVAGPAQVARLDPQILDRVILLGPTRKGTDDSDTRLGDLGSRGIGFTNLTAAHETDHGSVLPVDLRSDDLAAIAYTSGTTGAPKGVMLTHANFLADAQAAAQAISAGPEDRLMLVLPLSHTFPMAGGMVTSVQAGFEIVFESDLRRLAERMAEIRPTIFMGVPALYESMYRTIVAKLKTDGKLATFRRAEYLAEQTKRRTGVNLGPILFRELHQRLGGRIRLLATGGAATSPALIRRYLNLGLPLLQGWGLAEATSIVTAQSPSPFRFLFTNYFERLAGSAGRVVNGVDLRLADVPEKQLFAAEGEGEILVRGPTVMSGYYQNEDATRATFRDGWLRSGDLGHLDREGNLTITGRVKSVIVLASGEKVYPDEIEEPFADRALSHDICVLGSSSAKQLPEVWAVVYPDPVALRERAKATGQSLSPELVRRWVEGEIEHVQAGIAPFKRIREVILTDSPLPRTELRKVRRGLITATETFDLDHLLSPVLESPSRLR